MNRNYSLAHLSAPTTTAVQAIGQVADGVGMLVEQAAEAFLLWRGVCPDTRALIDGLRNLGG